MTETPQKFAFGGFDLARADSGGQTVISTAQTLSIDEKVRAAAALRAWDVMAQGAYPPNTKRAWASDWRAFTQF